MKIVTIGAGPHAAATHGPALRALAAEDSGLELAAICDLDGERAGVYARCFGYRRVYTDYRLMLETERPDGVTLAVPPGATAGIGADILRRGIPLLLEKPPGRNLIELRQLQDAFRSRNTPHLIAFNRRYMPLVGQGRELWRKVMGGEPLRHLRYDFYRHDRHDRDFSTTAVHGIDLVRSLSGSDYREEMAVTVQRSAAGEVESILVAGLTEAGQSVQFSFCPLSGCSFERIHLASARYAMTLELPTLGCSDRPGRIRLYRRGQKWRVLTEAVHPLREQEFYRGGFYHENRHFLERLRCGGFSPREADLERVDAVMVLTERISRAIAASASVPV